MPNVEALKQAVIRLCPDITDADFEVFIPAVKLLSLQKEDYFYRPNEVHKYIGFVNSGLVRCFYIDEKGDEKNTRFVFAHDYAVDYTSFLEQKGTPSAIKALEPTELILIPHAVFYGAVQQSRNWERFGRMIAEEIFQRTQRRLESLVQKSPEQRYLDLLNDRPDIIHRITLYHLASYLGIERESLSRIRNRMAKRRM